MRLKTYTVNSLPEGMAQIKRDLGEEALILNTKKVKTNGFLGFFKKEKLEIIAAVETQHTMQRRQPKKDSTLPVNSNEEITNPAGKQTEWEKAIVEAQAERPAKTELKATTIQSADMEESLTGELMNELKMIKKMMVQVMEEDRLPESLKRINQQLIRQEITADIRSDLLAKLMLVIGQNPNYSNDQVDVLVRDELIKLLATHHKTPERKETDMICFVGPTGVGKTTTIAKIAADYLLNEDKKVGLITSDTYRIAAVEQLKTYAGILNIPIQIVQSPAEVKQAIAELGSCDIILMDTAGRNYQQQQYINELELLLSDKHKIQINLVLSLTSKYEDMKKIINNFNSITIDQLLLTKKDETSSYGSILNLIYEYSIPLRYITNGQNVPDDIVAVTPELMANFLLGEDEND